MAYASRIIARFFNNKKVVFLINICYLDMAQATLGFNIGKRRLAQLCYLIETTSVLQNEPSIDSKIHQFSKQILGDPTGNNLSLLFSSQLGDW